MSNRLQNLKTTIAKGQDKLDALSYYGRIGVCLLGCFVIFILWFLILKTPLNAAHHALKVEKQMKLNQIQVLNDKVDVILDEAAGKNVDAKRKKLTKDLKSLDKKLAVYANEFVPANKLDDVFRDLLNRQKGLKLLSVRSLPSRQLSSQVAEGNAKHPIVMEDGLRLTFSGSYFATLKYLQDLEALHWRIFWDSLDYQVGEYPDAKVTLVIHTISTKEVKQ